MRNTNLLQALSAAAALMLLTACSGGGSSALAPKPASPSGHAQILTGYSRNPQHIVGYYACPANGQIEYASDAVHWVITVYAGNFAGQPPCGRITTGVQQPSGLHVDFATHDLYVANSGGGNILVFHRGQTSPYNTYSDPIQQYPIDVTLVKDGTVIASNLSSFGSEAGSLSTWIGGPNGGTFVGNFPMTHDEQGGFIAVRKNGTVYYNDIDLTTKQGALWSLSCPAGACGTQTQVAGVSSIDPAGMAIDSTGDLLMTDTSGVGETFELPNPNPKTFPIFGHPYGIAMNQSGHHLFIGDWSGPKVQEYAYPSGTFIGAVKGAQYGWLRGVAVDQ
jgi:DNA-binding beta-propeller fold protein YncE